MDPALSDIEKLKQKIASSQLPSEICEKLNNLLRYPNNGAEYDKLTAYVDFVLKLPFNKSSQDILDLNRAMQILNKNHYGLQSVKDRVLEYLSVLILNSRQSITSNYHAPILAFIGLVGTGKTSIAYSIAESLGRKIIRIPFGGLGEPAQLRGTSRTRPDAEPGLVIRAIQSAGAKNPIILLDEIDRIAEEGRVGLMGVLVELLDPAQNSLFIDHYLDFPFDLSQVMFIATANNTTNIATAVMDRLEPIQMPSYSDEEKLVIAKNYLLPKAETEAGIDSGMILVNDDVWPLILRPLGFDAGIRSLTRALQGVSRKIAMKLVQGQSGPFKVTTENIKEYIQG